MKHINRIKKLQSEAGAHNDNAMVNICQKAIDGDQDAYNECVRVLRENTERLLADLSAP